MAIRWSSVFSALYSGDLAIAEANTPFEEGIHYPISAAAIHYPYLHKQAVVVETIAVGQLGRIYLANTWWKARCLQPIALAAGTPVRVTGRDQLTLIVEPLGSTGGNVDLSC
jgi:hypothetical protein